MLNRVDELCGLFIRIFVDDVITAASPTSTRMSQPEAEDRRGRLHQPFCKPARDEVVTNMI